MGNSEVGHNAMGAGEIVLQRSAAVENDVNTGEIFNTKTWLDIIERIHQNNSTLMPRKRFNLMFAHTILTLRKSRNAEGVSSN